VDSDYLYVVSRIPLRAETVSRWAKADKISRLPALRHRLHFHLVLAGYRWPNTYSAEGLFSLKKRALGRIERFRLTNHMVTGVDAGPGFDFWLFPGEPRRPELVPCALPLGIPKQASKIAEVLLLSKRPGF
jgi:hypothetical protein